jgi:hypothetical protein
MIEDFASLHSDDLLAMYLGYEDMVERAEETLSARRRGGDPIAVDAARVRLVGLRARRDVLRAAWNERRGPTWYDTQLALKEVP